VVAFDLPINDLIPPDMPLDSFRLDPDSNPEHAHYAGQRGAESVSISFNGSKIEIASSLNSTGMRLVWQVPFGTLLLDTLQNILLPLLLNIGLLALALFGYSTFRFQPGRQSDASSVPAGTSNELRVTRTE
jgi:two-component system sensor histidine kinase RcsD